MLEGFWFQGTAGAGGIGVGGRPGRVGGQVAISGSHLMDSPSNELLDSHEGSRIQGGGWW